MGLLDRFTSSDEASTSQTPDKYRLLVTAGPSYDTTKHQIVPVNGDEAITISNEYITAKVKVRVRGYRGLPSGSPASNVYFDDPVHEKDQYSLAFSFVPKQDIPSVDTVWGNDFDHPIRDRLPPGFNTAFKIVKEFIDPGLACDAYADEPWLYGPSLSCWFAFRIGDKVTTDGFPAPDDQKVMRDGADGSGREVRQELGIPENNEKRRKFYLDAKNRKSLVFEKGRLYQADFYNPYLDFGNLALKLPGFSLKVYKYIDAKSHCLRYVFKNRETGDMYLNVNFNLLWGEQLEKALAKEKDTPSGSEPEAEDASLKKEASNTDTEGIPRTGEVRKKDATAHSQDASSDKQAATKGKQSSAPVEVIPTEPAQSEQSQKAQAETPVSQQPEELHKSINVWESGDQKKGGADEISSLLAQTATSDKTGQETSILDVD
ncbi:hypothetical protein AMS68_000305 [Peltaster fructicola]|uniref:Domain of unknown function at the cortex 1 domain-containing protein n=1 Tax=Peltaster fructicola TaxID=286661 RepID=A0A6H0XJH8_9PEZI|nr:hypothetical protein AMS68_000305 [Peltaster fructicola]